MRVLLIILALSGCATAIEPEAEPMSEDAVTFWRCLTEDSAQQPGECK